MVSRIVNKVYCCALDSQTCKLFDRQPGSAPLWPNCSIPSNNAESPHLMHLRNQKGYLAFLHWSRYRRWTPACGAEVSGVRACVYVCDWELTLLCGGR
jgi:hypothetical protein